MNETFNTNSEKMTFKEGDKIFRNAYISDIKGKTLIIRGIDELEEDWDEEWEWEDPFIHIDDNNSQIFTSLKEGGYRLYFANIVAFDVTTLIDCKNVEIISPHHTYVRNHNEKSSSSAEITNLNMTLKYNQLTANYLDLYNGGEVLFSNSIIVCEHIIQDGKSFRLENSILITDEEIFATDEEVNDQNFEVPTFIKSKLKELQNKIVEITQNYVFENIYQREQIILYNNEEDMCYTYKKGEDYYKEFEED